jgi:hypothetical protein
MEKSETMFDIYSLWLLAADRLDQCVQSFAALLS